MVDIFENELLITNSNSVIVCLLSKRVIFSAKEKKQKECANDFKS